MTLLLLFLRTSGLSYSSCCLLLVLCSLPVLHFWGWGCIITHGCSLSDFGGLGDAFFLEKEEEEEGEGGESVFCTCTYSLDIRHFYYLLLRSGNGKMGSPAYIMEFDGYISKVL